MSLIQKIFDATQSGDLNKKFTVEELKNWILTENVRKTDGTKYAKSSIDAILSNSDLKNSPTTNKNKKILKSELNQNGKKVYWF